MTPSERLLQRVLVTSGIDSKEWNTIQADLRERAFFSAKVESARLLQTARTYIARHLAQGRTGEGGTFATRAQTVTAIAERARKEGLSDGSGRITDLGSIRRAALIADTNAAFAAGAVRRKADLSVGARLACPAQELVRVRQSKAPRDWRARWEKNGGKIYRGRMVALIEDPIWKRISTFKLPYPPFDWGSGMGIMPVDWDEAVELGVITDDYMPEPVDKSDGEINHDLFVSTKELDKPALDALKEAFGDQISIRGDEMNWHAGVIRKRLHGEGTQKVSLGKAQNTLLAKLPPSMPRDLVANRNLSIAADWIRTHGQKHIEGRDTDPRNIPLVESDYDLIATMWHDPDKIETYGDDPLKLTLKLETFDGGILKLGVNLNKGPHLTTFHKEAVKDKTAMR